MNIRNIKLETYKKTPFFKYAALLPHHETSFANITYPEIGFVTS